MKRRNLLQALCLGPGLVTSQAPRATEADFPSRPLRLIVSSGPGALVDIAGRLYAGRMSQALKQSIVIENMAGASSLLAVRQTLKARPDGYTLLVAANTLVTLPHINPAARYTVDDLSAIGELATSPVLLVTGASSPYRNLKDLLAAAASKPDTLSYGSSGIGTTNHLAVKLLARQANVRFTHLPYKGIAAAIPDVVSGRVDFMMGTATSTAELLKSGALRALCISSVERSPEFPTVPTLVESELPKASFELWVGMVAPAGVPDMVRDKLAAAIAFARAEPALQRQLEAASQRVPVGSTPAQFAALLRSDSERFAQLAKAAHIVAQ